MGEKKKCTSCGTFAKKNRWFLLISLYMAYAAIYGTIEIAKSVYTYFTR
jgi:hypothetical protein